MKYEEIICQTFKLVDYSFLKMSRNVAYFYRGIVLNWLFFIEGIGDYIYKPGHPMKPQRIKLTHHLLLSYELYYKMEVYVL